MVFAIIVTGTLGLIWFAEWGRRERLRYMERAERLRIELSDLRFRLVQTAGDPRFQHSDKKAFAFLYMATTGLLKYPKYYREFSDLLIQGLLNPEQARQAERLRKDDVSFQMRPLFKEFVSIADELIGSFARPIFVILATSRGKSVVEWCREVGVAMTHAKERRAEIQHLRDRAALIPASAA